MSIAGGQQGRRGSGLKKVDPECSYSLSNPFIVDKLHTSHITKVMSPTTSYCEGLLLFKFNFYSRCRAPSTMPKNIKKAYRVAKG